MEQPWGYTVINRFKDAEALAAYYLAAGEDVPKELEILLETLWAEIVRLNLQELV